MHYTDTLTRFVFEHLPIRGEIVGLHASYRAVSQRHDYVDAVYRLLGEAMAGAALLSATIKFNGSVILQVRGRGPVHLLVVECNSSRQLRAIARVSGTVAGERLANLLGADHLVITLNPAGAGERYQGIVSLDESGLATSLENYFANSEQLPTQLCLAADKSFAGGLLLQHLPGNPIEGDDWNRISRLSATITEAEILRLPPATILHRLFHEEDIRIFSPEPVSFRCNCSRDGIVAVLRALGYQEVRSILEEQRRIQVDCEFCNQHYEFDIVDTEEIFAAAEMFAGSPTQH